MNAMIKVDSREITPNLTCKLCNGYFIDATTIIECLHSFCKSCIVKHLEQSEYCPVCDVQLHTSKPLLSIKSDQMLQEVVYKLVPGLFQKEMQRRRDFYQENGQSTPVSQVDSGLVYNESYITPEDIIHLSLEYYTNDIEFRKSTKRFYTCPAAVSISILKKLIQAKYDLSNEASIEVMFGQRILPDDFLLMDITYKYSWTQNGKPLQLCYHVKGPSGAFKVQVPSNPIEKDSLTDTTTINEKSSLVKKHSRATCTSRLFNTNGIIVTPTRPLIVTNGIVTSQGSQTFISNPDTTITPITPKGRKKKKSALVEANNQADLINTPPNLHIPFKLKSKIKSIRHMTNKNGTKVEGKEKEVQLRISENGVISARNVASGEEKIILGANNNVVGPTLSSSSPIHSTATTTIISPATAALAASPTVNIHVPTSNNSNNNGIVSNHLMMTPGSNRIMSHNNNSNNMCSTNGKFNLNSSTTTTLSNSKQQQQMNHGKQKNSKPSSLSRKKFQIMQGTPCGTMPKVVGSASTTALPSKAMLCVGKSTDGNTMGNKVVKVSKKRKLVNSSTNVNGPTIGSNKGGTANNMETLKAATKRLKEELETKGIEFELLLHHATPVPMKTIPDAQHFPSGTVCNVIPNPPNSNMKGNLSKRLQQVSTTHINGDTAKYTTTPPKKNLLSSSPNTKIFPKSSLSNSPGSKSHSPSVSPKKPPKFFKSRHSTADANTTTLGSPNYCVSNSIANGTSPIHNNGNSNNKKVKLNHITNASKEQNNIQLSSVQTSTVAGSNTTTVMSTAVIPTPTTLMLSQPTIVSTNTSTSGQPFRFPELCGGGMNRPISMNFPNGMPMNLVPFSTSNYSSWPFVNSLKNINIPSLPFGNPYMDYATAMYSVHPGAATTTTTSNQLQSLSQSLQNGNGNISKNGTSLDLSAKINHNFSTLSSTNGTTTIIVPHVQTSHLQNQHPQVVHTTSMLNNNNNYHHLLNARVISDSKTTTVTNNEQFLQNLTSTKEVPSSALLGNISNNLVETTNSKSLNSPNTKLSHQMDTNEISQPNGITASSGIQLTKVKLNESEPLSITSSLVAAQNHMKGIHNLGLGVNNVTTKNPRKSSSPAKLGRAKQQQQLSSTPEKAGKSKAVTETTINVISEMIPGSTTTTETVKTTSPAKENEIVNESNRPTADSLISPSNLNNNSPNNTVTIPSPPPPSEVASEPTNLENGHTDCSKVNDDDKTTIVSPSPTNGIEMKDDVSSSGSGCSDEFAMQIDEGTPPTTMDEDVPNSGDESAQNTNVLDNNNVVKDSPPVVNNNNNNVSQSESSSTTTTSSA